MTKNENQPTIEPERYQYAVAAAQFLNSKDAPAAKKCLEKLAQDMNLDSDAQAGLVWNVSNDTDGWAKAVNTYTHKYQQVLEAKTVGALFDRYGSFFKKYLNEEEMKVAKNSFDAFENVEYASIVKAVEKAEEILQSETGNFTKEQKESAEKIKEKYSKISSTITEFELLKLQSLMLPIKEGSIKDKVKERFKVGEAKQEKKK